MQDPLNVGDLLKYNLLSLDFDDGDTALFARDSYIVRVSRHNFAFRRGDYADGLHVVVVGAIKLVLPGAYGQCKVVEFFGPGEYFGEPFMFLNRSYAADMQAMEDSLLVWIGKRTVDNAFHVHLRLARQMLTGLSTRPYTLMYGTETADLQSANERPIGYLLPLPRKLNRTRFPCDKGLVASELGLAPATLFRTLRRLIRDGLIRVEGREVMTQNITALQRQLVAGQQ